MKKVLILLCAVAIAGLGAYAYMEFAQHSPSTAPYVVPPLTQSYANPTYGFSLMMPADFSAHESSDSGASSTSIVLQDESGNGIQITVSPFDEDTGGGYTLTADRIHQDLPDLEIDDAQTVTVGPQYTGLAFLSDNPAFDGNSREVWFVFRGNLYQVSTYAQLDPLLGAIFKTWQFN
jgi:hypothetical protein